MGWVSCAGIGDSVNKALVIEDVSVNLRDPSLRAGIGDSVNKALVIGDVSVNSRDPSLQAGKDTLLNLEDPSLPSSINTITKWTWFGIMQNASKTTCG